MDTTPSRSAVTASDLRACLKAANIDTLDKDNATITTPDGETSALSSVDVNGVPLAAIAVWPSKHYAWVYVAPNEEATKSGIQQLSAYTKAYGGDPKDYVQSQGNVIVYLDDHDQPTADEAKALNDCAKG